MSKEIKRLGCQQSKNDPALYFKFDDHGNVEGIITAHVDDLLHAGTKRFENQVIRKIKEIFKMGETKKKSFTYVGFEIHQDQNGILLKQDHYIKEKIELFEVPAARRQEPDARLTEEEVTLLRQAAGRLGWVSGGCRPDISFTRVELSTRFKKATVRDLITASKALKKLKEAESYYVIPRKLGNPDKWWLELSCDGSLGNLEERSTSGYMLLLRGEGDSCAPISWSSNRIQKVVCSALGAEIMSMQVGIEEATFMREVFEELLGKKKRSMRLNVLTDSKSLVEAIHGYKPISNKRLRMNMEIIKQALQEKEVDDVSWVPTKEMIADVLTKKGVNPVHLIRILQTGQRNINAKEA